MRSEIWKSENEKINLQNDKQTKLGSQTARLHNASITSSYAVWLGSSRKTVNTPVWYDGTGIS